MNWKIIVDSSVANTSENKDFLKQAAELLPKEPFNLLTWDEWILKIKEKTGKKGKDLFMPMRIALTGLQKGPELKYLLPLLSKENILKKFGIIT